MSRCHLLTVEYVLQVASVVGVAAVALHQWDVKGPAVGVEVGPVDRGCPPWVAPLPRDPPTWGSRGLPCKVSLNYFSVQCPIKLLRSLVVDPTCTINQQSKLCSIFTAPL